MQNRPAKSRAPPMMVTRSVGVVSAGGLAAAEAGVGRVIFALAILGAFT